MIEWTLRLTDLLVVLGFSGTLMLYVFRAGKYTAALSNMQTEIIALKDVAKSVADILTTVAIQKTEMLHIRDDINELKHGRGFVVAASN